MPDTYGYEVDEKRARETLNAIFDGPINFLDTSNNYGFGRSEARIGDALRERGGLPDGFVISTKVDRDMESGTFDASRTRRSLEESLTRLGLEKEAQELEEAEGRLARVTLIILNRGLTRIGAVWCDISSTFF